MSFSWSKDEVHVRISRLLDAIVNLANEDNIITEEEDAIIESARQKLWKMEDEFLKLKETNTSLEDAREHVKVIIEQVINSVTETAKEDNKISSDEIILIDRIAKYLRTSDLSNLLN